MNAEILTATTQDKASLQCKAMLSFNFLSYYLDYKKQDIYAGTKEVKDAHWYGRVSKAVEYLGDFMKNCCLSEWTSNDYVGSTILTDDVGALAKDALMTTELYEALKLISAKEIELDVVSNFKRFEKVSAIYTQKYRSELQVTIFLNIEQYDNNLMHEMFDLEYDLHTQHPESIVSFSYIPGVYKNRRDVVHHAAKLIFER